MSNGQTFSNGVPNGSNGDDTMETAVSDGQKPKRVRKPASKPKAAGKNGNAGSAKRAAKASKNDGAVKVRPNLDNYDVNKDIKTPSGRPSVDIGDATANKLRGMTLDQVYALASKTLGVPMTELHRKYDHLNPGMQRMNLGNRLRAASRPPKEKKEKKAKAASK